MGGGLTLDNDDAGGVHWDFFISYTQADRAWAEWIAWILEEDKHSVLVQAWDFVPGTNWTQSMQDGVTYAAKTITVLSDAYLQSVFGKAEWLAVWSQDPLGAQRKLLPIRVEACERPGLLAPIVGIDIFGVDEAKAKARLRTAVARAIEGRAKPSSSPTFPGAQRAITRPSRFPGAMPTVWKVPARNPNFTGRDEELATIANELSASARMTVHSLHGMGGIGKTQLAIEYAHTRAGNYDLVWSIAAEEPATIPDQFAALAKCLELEPASNPDDLRDQVHEQLKTVAGWLLIFDNANEVEDVRPWLPNVPLPAGLPGHVIITTRRGGFKDLGRVMDLNVLGDAAAVRVLRARVPDLEQEIADQIAELLGRLPLALEQAAAYLDRTEMPPIEYLDLLRTSLNEMLTEGSVPSRPDITIGTVWNLSLDRIRTEDPAAVQLLDIMAYYAPESIPTDLFTLHTNHLPEPLAIAASTPLAFNKTVATLVDYSLVKRTPSGLQLHRLLQAAVRARHRDTGTH
jgi:hypothetical protein